MAFFEHICCFFKKSITSHDDSAACNFHTHTVQVNEVNIPEFDSFYHNFFTSMPEVIMVHYVTHLELEELAVRNKLNQ